MGVERTVLGLVSAAASYEVRDLDRDYDDSAVAAVAVVVVVAAAAAAAVVVAVARIDFVACLPSLQGRVDLVESSPRWIVRGLVNFA